MGSSEVSVSSPVSAGGFTSETPPRRARLLLVVLNFNGIVDTLACLDSLTRQTSADFATLVIDNGSSADDLTPIGARFPEVELIALPENLGWAGGNNVGMRLAVERGFDYVCLLNNDTVLDPTAVEAMLEAADFLQRPCLLHPTIAYFDEPETWQVNPPAGPNDTLPLGIVEMDWAYGACLLFPRSVIEKVGLLDERFFVQLEETDYFRRAKSLGIPSLCAGKARILHKESVSFGGRITPAKTYYQVRNSFLLAEKHTPSLPGYFRTFRSLIWALHHQARDSGAVVTGHLDLLRWLFSARPLAQAAREGARDYIFRRFGRRSQTGIAKSPRASA